MTHSGLAMSALSIAVISLAPEAPEVRRLLFTLAELGFDATIFPAVDGRKAMPVLEDGESVDHRKALLRRRATLYTGEIACFLSHSRAIKQAYARGDERLLILEDDVEILAGFADVVHAVTALPAEAELVRLMGLKRRRRKVIATLASKWSLVRPLRGWCGTQGYIINRAGMAKFIQHADVISMAIDSFYDCFWETGIRCYGIEPHVLVERAHPSSIAKQWGKVKPNAWTNLRWQVFKLYRGVLMRYYRLAHYSDFYPNAFPDDSVKFARSKSNKKTRYSNSPNTLSR
ncbi:glycosyltransferase family 25 protein [Zhongshania aliphaticivorans]|nr:glycosyltransferase family 25 protein [Zhongshania aliphaticivorans]